MAHVNLLGSLPRSTRDIAERREEKSATSIIISRQFGREYFDGDRRFGYGGYYYDERWRPVARDLVGHYKLSPGDRVLDVGCAKGFLVADLRVYGVAAYGVDISRYAVVEQPDPNVVGVLHVGDARDLPFPPNSFDVVLSINTLHNLDRDEIVRALQEMKRVCRPGGGMFVQVDSYRTEAEKAAFFDWVLTARWTGTPDEWIELFVEAGYDGDYDWTIV